MSTRPLIAKETDPALLQSLDSLSAETGIEIPERDINYDSNVGRQAPPLIISHPTTSAPFSGELSTRGLASARKLRSAHSLDDGRRIATRERLLRLKESSALIEQLQAKKEKAISAKNPVHGLFKNPYFKYRGGLFSKLLTFFANLIKFIELLVLRLLSGPKNPTTVVVKQPQKADEVKNSKEILEKKKKAAARR